MKFLTRNTRKSFDEERNLDVLKNVLAQVYLALTDAYSTCKFVHHDLHLDNILLRKTEKRDIVYSSEGSKLKLQGVYALVMDFGRITTKGNDKEFCTSLQTMFSLLRDIGTQTTVILDSLPIVGYLQKSKSDGAAIETKKMLSLIANVSVDYEKRVQQQT